MAGQFIATTGTVWGMDCEECEYKIKASLKAVSGVRDVSLRYPDPTLGVLHNDSVTQALIVSTVEAAGFRIDVTKSA
ncbi:cation transporter [Aureimonas altamirensis]|uniref:heavy-metal-associated domain-containing protein n=1 Tax=Aureimonas altamirensis TaxID=370622 RepID=UPI0020367BD0|nr:cation transporter [Aureimonas altamirensis]MCM2505709.1 cation transporter [Aureimonas altamirensis]